MAIPTPEKLGLFYPSRDLTAPNTALPTRTVASGSTTMSIATNSITQADGFWNGALGFFYSTDTQVELRGQMFHVQRWSKTDNRLYITSPLPVTPITTDKFQIFSGGLYASNQDVFGLRVQPSSGRNTQPEVDVVNGTNISGIRILKASGMLGPGTLDIQYTASTKGIAIRMNTGLYGPSETITASGQIAVFNSDFSGFVLLSVEYALLPTTGSPVDTFNLTIPHNVVIPNFEGFETNTGSTLKRYHLVVMKNTSVNPIDAMSAFTVWCEMPNYPTTTATQGFSATAIMGQPAALTVADASSWPSRGFWIRNQSAQGIAYVRYRNGNTLYLASATDGVCYFTLGQSNLQVGSTYNLVIANSLYGSIRVTKVVVTSGSLAGGNAAGFLWFDNCNATVNLISSSNSIYIATTDSPPTNPTTVARSNQLSRGFRFSNAANPSGWFATDWVQFSASTGNVLEIIPDFDLSMVDSDGTFANPETVYDEPAGTSFGIYTSASNSTIKDILTGGQQVGLWIRQSIIDGTQSRQNIVGNIRAMWN